MNRNTQDFIDAEYRIKISHFTQQGFDIKGVVHVGASTGYEVQWYKKLGIENILCFEPLPSAWETLTKAHPDVLCALIALSDENGEGEFYVTYGDGAGSSLQNMLDESQVVQDWEDNKVIVDKIQVRKRRFDTWASTSPKSREAKAFDPDLYDCLVMDVQGHELKALNGFGEFLQCFKYLNIECSSVPVYENEAPAQEVIDFLAEQGFIQDSPIESHNDIFFVRKDIKSESDKVYRGLA